MVDLPKIDAVELFNQLTFTARKKHLSALLQCKAQDEMAVTLNNGWREFLELCINAHHRSHVDTRIHGAKIISNYTYDHNNFYCSYTLSGALEKAVDVIGIGSTMSANPTRDPVAIQRTKVLAALRKAIHADMHIVKSYLLHNQSNCECGVQLNATNTHLDHTGEDEFRHVASKFLSRYSIADIRLKPDFMKGDALADNAFIDKWIDFHNSNTRVQLLCAACNLSKPKGWGDAL